MHKSTFVVVCRKLRHKIALHHDDFSADCIAIVCSALDWNAFFVQSVALLDCHNAHSPPKYPSDKTRKSKLPNTCKTNHHTRFAAPAPLLTVSPSGKQPWQRQTTNKAQTQDHPRHRMSSKTMLWNTNLNHFHHQCTPDTTPSKPNNHRTQQRNELDRSTSSLLQFMATAHTCRLSNSPSSPLGNQSK